jgi:hypothetical protein
VQADAQAVRWSITNPGGAVASAVVVEIDGGFEVVIGLAG